jgi:purine-binding chemotaxis protein CheW
MNHAEEISTDNEQHQYLTFFIAEEEYAVSILRVREILEYDTVTRLPSTPAAIRGVINLRGRVVPVVDLARKFGLPESPVTKTTCTVIVEVGEGESQTVMGIMTDLVSQVVELKPGEIEPPPAFGTRIHLEFLKGLGRAGKKFVLMLDIDKVLSSDELAAAYSHGDSAAAPVTESV